MPSWKRVSRDLERLRAAHGRDRSLLREFPDLSVDRQVPPCTCGMAGPTYRQQPRPSVPHLVVGTPHKQGSMVMPRSELPWAGGKKP